MPLPAGEANRLHIACQLLSVAGRRWTLKTENWLTGKKSCDRPTMSALDAGGVAGGHARRRQILWRVLTALS